MMPFGLVYGPQDWMYRTLLSFPIFTEASITESHPYTLVRVSRNVPSLVHTYFLLGEVTDTQSKNFTRSMDGPPFNPAPSTQFEVVPDSAKFLRSPCL